MGTQNRQKRRFNQFSTNENNQLRLIASQQKFKFADIDRAETQELATKNEVALLNGIRL